MTNKEIYVLLFLITCWIILSGIASFRIMKNDHFSNSTIRVKILLTWLIPFFWALIIILFTSKTNKRKVDDRNKHREAGYKGYTRYG